MDLKTPKGATLLSNDQVRFEVWSPSAKSVEVQLVDVQDENESLLSAHPMSVDEFGIWTVEISGLNGATLYRYSVDQGAGRPDPRSRFQPFGVHGPSQVVDTSFDWRVTDWKGVAKEHLVIYELHVGSLTESGTYLEAIEHLPRLVDLGVTAIEVLPLAQSPGRWNWGYDGVNYFAPRNTFGTPSDLRTFIDACHSHSIAVFNDVVYNHVGPEGNYLSEFGPYRSPKRGTPWGDAFNFDGENSEQVRQFVIDNIEYWIQEFQFDGVRLDAVHYMFDDSHAHILDEIQSRFSNLSDSLDRRIYLIGESNIYDAHLVGDLANSQPHHDAIWSDCLMHSIYTIGKPELRLTNRHYRETDLAEAIEEGYVFCTPEAIRATPTIRTKNHQSTTGRQYLSSMITALQTHDSVGNHPHGKRLHQLTDVAFQKAALPLILLYPSIPMLFMGEETATESPFPFFADFEDSGLRKAVDRGRQEEYPHHDWQDSPLPSDPLAFTNSKLRTGNDEVFHWYRSLLQLRKQGVESGWLAPGSLSTETDVGSQVYQLRYESSDESILIVSRLDNPKAKSTSLDEILDRTQFPTCILNSHGDETSLVDDLEPRHCLIFSSNVNCSDADS